MSNGKEPAEGAGTGGKILVLSDTHFGDDSALLTDERLVERLVDALADRGEVSELVLLGDVLDLWVKITVPALRRARIFIDRLSRLENVEKVVYVPGNHDYQMFLDAFRLETDVRVMQGDLTVPRFVPARHYGSTVLSGLAHPGTRVKFSMTYPFLTRRARGVSVVLCHGHHLDFYSTAHGWAKSFWLGRHIIKKRRKKASLHDIEMANIPFCVTMSAAPWVPELVNEGLRYYRIISFFAKLFRSESLRTSPLRDSLIRENYEEIAQFLPQLEQPLPAAFVFGHTHRPGIGELPGARVTIANTGSWTRIEDELAPTRTWVEIDGSVSLYTLGRGGAELMESVRIGPPGGRDGVR